MEDEHTFFSRNGIYSIPRIFQSYTAVLVCTTYIGIPDEPAGWGPWGVEWVPAGPDRRRQADGTPPPCGVNYMNDQDRRQSALQRSGNWDGHISATVPRRI